MAKFHTPLLIFILLLVLSCNRQSETDLHYRAKQLSADIYEMAYEPGNWEHPEYGKPFESLGNQRIVLEVDDTVRGPVQVVIPWRRPDPDPETKAMIITGAGTGNLVERKQLVYFNRESCHLVFQPLKGETSYYVYYLPHRSTGGYYPKLSYISPGDPPDNHPAWQVPEDSIDGLPHARILSAQSIDDFHSFYPMEVIAAEAEVAAYTRALSADYYIFPEFRERPVRMTGYLPVHWVKDTVQVNGLMDTVTPGEFYPFQVGLWSPEFNLSNVRLEFSDLHSGREHIAAEQLTCFNLEGTDLEGNPFIKRLDVPVKTVQALWCGIDIPKGITSGTYSGTVIVRPEGMLPDTVFLNLIVDGNRDLPIDDNTIYMSRLKWINSTIGLDIDFVARPYIPLKINGKTIHILGRDIELGPSGLPSQIYSWFTPEMTKMNDTREPMLAGPMQPVVMDPEAGPLTWKWGEYTVTSISRGKSAWQVTGAGTSMVLKVEGTVEYDGMVECRMSLIAKEDTDISDFIFHIPMLDGAAEYMLGLGYKGCKRPRSVDWKWDVAEKHQEGAWLGTVNKGLQFVLRDDRYERPLNTNFYRQKPLIAPGSWDNGGKGGIRIHEGNRGVDIIAYSGSRRLLAGDTLHFNIRFLITPFKLIDTESHFKTRFVHRYVPIDSVIAWKGTIVNVHHANEINPYINYPFYNTDLQKAYIDEAHGKGVKVKLYNTIRELSYRAYELYPLRSLGFEIFNDGDGGGHSWLQEHLRDHYHAAWHATSVNDASILNKGTSRWTNYYIEGINWLAKNQHIDGLYLDDIAFSRTTVKRLANVLQTNRSEVVIDLHSANQFNERDGYINSAFLYMEHMPYITRLWFGEYFEYDLGPDYWLTEVSGIPCGLTGEMLEGGGHPWRGLVYGMTTRIYGDVDPRPLWKLFDDYDIAGSEMLGYWVDRSPVKTNVPGIKTTAYVHKDHVLIAIGSWSEKDELVPLDIDWDTLGMDKSAARLFCPEIDGLQPAAGLDPDKPVFVEKLQGRVVVLDRKHE